MKLFQLKDGYRYNSDSLFLYDFISKNKIFGNLLDVGCGCGILGLLLKRDFVNLNLSSIDIQEINSTITQLNADVNSLVATVICDDFSKFKSEMKFDFIVSNPPFYSDQITKSQKEHINISRYSSSLDPLSFFKCVNANLKPQGTLYFCYDARRVGEILPILSSFKLKLTKLRFVHSKVSESSKLGLFEAKKSSKSMCEIYPPLIVFDGNEFSDEAKEIFKKSDTKSEIYEC
ncbi:tRNA1(Val) (adenine(37)-N6)-methyltransferase [Campylobacter fetus]|uniref:tRNA1(Val) (adenine(37)-N6)-methyltransferase n=1 Tax=Campylobacter fetus TaxID=196 RepID=UPI000818C8D4|nr:methyltransferase [Campylobacter fetus]OCR92564.1 methyltransferase [Campylobacter fetus subsp. testudinum]OCS03401.1 methyltransferase [Campylobacter fetus subsp. testudinum]